MNRRAHFAGRRFALVGVFATILLAPDVSGAAPDAELWQRWTAHDAAARAVIDHGEWDRLLARFVRAGPDGSNRFAYREVDAEARGRLDAYLDSLARRTISSFSRPEQKAYWINLYNALTVRTVLDRYPVETIRDIDISPGWFSDGPWGAELISVEGEALALDDVEHRILRPIWRDARLHYALNCAAAGCPQLAAEAYTGAAVERQLDLAARAFVNHSRGVEATGDRVLLSRIYDWYADDFGDGRDDLFAHLSRFASPALAAILERRPRIAGYRYDWALNDAMPEPPEASRDR